MRFLPHLSAFIVGLTSTAAMAEQSQPMSLDYATFEAAVAHVDLETCPVSLNAADRFCRATLAHEQIHIFAFSMEGDSPLVGFASFEATTLPELLN
jgi:hypothetical protein